MKSCKKQLSILLIITLLMSGGFMELAKAVEERILSIELKQDTNTLFPRLSVEAQTALEKQSDMLAETELIKEHASIKEQGGFWHSISTFFSILITEKAKKEKEITSVEEEISFEMMALEDPEPDLIAELHFNESGVNVLTKNHSRIDVDMETKMPGMPFDIARAYNSNSLVKRQDLMLGYKWKFVFNCEVKISNASNYRFVHFEFPDRGTERFTYEWETDLIGTGSWGSTYEGSTEDFRLGKGTVVTKDQYRYTYADNKRLTEIEDPYGNKTLINYESDPNNSSSYYRITSITDPLGRAYSFVYSQDHYCLDSIICPDGKVISYSYESYPITPNINKIRFLKSAGGDIKEKRFYNWFYATYNDFQTCFLKETSDELGNLLESRYHPDFNNYTYTDIYGNKFKFSVQSSHSGYMEDVNKYKTVKHFTGSYGY